MASSAVVQMYSEEQWYSSAVVTRKLPWYSEAAPVQWYSGAAPVQWPLVVQWSRESGGDDLPVSVSAAAALSRPGLTCTELGSNTPSPACRVQGPTGARAGGLAGAGTALLYYTSADYLQHTVMW